MSVLQKLKDLKRVLDRNLATRSNDVLPVINACIEELEQANEQIKEITEDKPVKTVDKKEIKQEEPKEVIEVKEEVNNEVKSIEELRKEYIEKFGKKPFAWWKEDVLIDKMK